MKRSILLAAILAGCVDRGAIENQTDATRTFDNATLTLERYPATCGVQAPPFVPADLYAMNLVGSAAGATTATAIDISFHPTLPAGEALPVSLNAFGVLSYATDANGNMIDVVYGQSGTLPFTDNSFEWDQGSAANTVDAQPLTSATVTIDVMPGSESASGALTVRMVFADGGIYDARWNAPLATEISGCPAG